MANYSEILGSDWARILKPFLTSSEWTTIRNELVQQNRSLTKMYPAADDIFKAFRSCPYGEMITVFLTTNPYGKENDGLAFSNKSNDFMRDNPKVLDKIFDAVEVDVASGLYLNRDPDLFRWADQGALLLNCDLTSIEGKPGAHLKLWHPFMKHLMKFMGTYNTGIVYVLIGAHAQKFEQYINKDSNDIIKLEHPMIAVKENRPWKHENVFSRINEISKFLNNRSIDWTKTINQWDK
jgi:uracil-DNA glycosylase